MSDREMPATEAARALRDVEQRRDQALMSPQESRWVSIVFAVVVLAGLAAPDFFDQRVSNWFALAIPAFGVLYTIMVRTRRGNALLGRPTRVRKEEISPRFLLVSRLTIISAAVIIILVMRFVDIELFPYARTVAGALLGIALIVFGQRVQRAMNSLAARDQGNVRDGAEQ